MQLLHNVLSKDTISKSYPNFTKQYAAKSTYILHRSSYGVIEVIELCNRQLVNFVRENNMCNL